MKLKVIFIMWIVSTSAIMANPVVTTIVKKVVKKAVPKVLPIITTIVTTSLELEAEEVKKKTISKKELDLYKIKF